MAIVVFDPTAFATAMPEFLGVSAARATAMFNVAASTLLDNTDNSAVMDLATRTQLFYFLIGHLLTLYGLSDTPTPNTTPVGRIASASQGTVSTSFDMPTGKDASATMGWYLQTQYGISYWMATQRFRSVRIYANGSSGIGYASAYGRPPFYIPGG